MKWQDISVDIKKLSPGGLSAPAPGLYTCIKSYKKCIKSDFKDVSLKLVVNDWSEKRFLLTSKFRPQGVVSPCPGAIYMYKIMRKKMHESDFKDFFFF